MTRKVTVLDWRWVRLVLVCVIVGAVSHRFPCAVLSSCRENQTDDAVLFKHEDWLNNPWNLRWRVDSSALVGMPKDYADAVCDYINSAILLLEGSGEIPTRTYLERAPASEYARIYHAHLDEFPVVVQIVGQYKGRVTIAALPQPEVVRACYRQPNLREIADSAPAQSDEDPAGLASIAFFVAHRDCSSWRLTLPTPHGFDGYRSSDHSTNGWQLFMGRWRYELTRDEFLTFPALQVFKDEATWLGALAATTVAPENRVLRWVYFNATEREDIETWLAYSVVDANGAYHGSAPHGPNGLTTDSFLRPLDAPFEPTLSVPPLTHKLPQAPNKHSLLRTPTPDVIAPSYFSYGVGEDWTITEDYYAEHEVPAWALWADKDSEPFRERFHITHALESTEHTLWKVVVFSNIRPSDLVAVIGKMKGIEVKDPPSNVEIERALGGQYATLQAIVERLRSEQ